MNSLIQYKKLLIVFSIIVPAIITIIVVINNKENNPKQQEEKKITFVFNDDFFGQIEKPEIKLNESIFIIPPEPEEYPEEVPEPIIILKEDNRKKDTFFNSKIISYDKKDKDHLSFLANKGNPSTIASKKYDLSRIITTNKYIPVVLETAINSEIPTQGVVAQVESDVYGYHAKDVLIPKGSKVEGVFETIKDKHSRKMQVAWYKIITPQGKIITLDSTSLDSHGASGFNGYLDQRLKDRYGAALLFSGINTLANLSVDIESTRQLAIVESITRELAPLTNQVIRENLNIKPIIQVRQGQRFNIKPHENILFKEVSSREISAIFLK